MFFSDMCIKIQQKAPRYCTCTVPVRGSLSDCWVCRGSSAWVLQLEYRLGTYLRPRSSLPPYAGKHDPTRLAMNCCRSNHRGRHFPTIPTLLMQQILNLDTIATNCTFISSHHNVLQRNFEPTAISGTTTWTLKLNLEIICRPPDFGK